METPETQVTESEFLPVSMVPQQCSAAKGLLMLMRLQVKFSGRLLFVPPMLTVACILGDSNQVACSSRSSCSKTYHTAARFPR